MARRLAVESDVVLNAKMIFLYYPQANPINCTVRQDGVLDEHGALPGLPSVKVLFEDDENSTILPLSLFCIEEE